MRLINRTKFHTPALRKFFIRALRELRKSEGSNSHFRNVKIICHSSRTWVTGRAAYHGYQVLLRIPSFEFVLKPDLEEHAKTDADLASWICRVKEQALTRRDTLAFALAWVFYHELWHTLGYNHRQMNDVNFKRLAEWAKTYGELPLGVNQPCKSSLATNLSMFRSIHFKSTAADGTNG